MEARRIHRSLLSAIEKKTLMGFASLAVGLPVAYLLLSIEVCLTTHTIGEFHLSFAAFSPAELQLLLIAGDGTVLFKPFVLMAGVQFLPFYHAERLS